MAENTKIEWTDHTFSPWTGCTKVSPACDHCYAEGWAKRSGHVKWGSGQPRRRTSDANWRMPLKWNREAERTGVRPRVFCASLADVFDNEVDPAWRADLFKLIADTQNLNWLLLTKRVGNVMKMANEVADMPRTGSHTGHLIAHQWRNGSPPKNVWLGATVVNQEEADRDIPKLLTVPAAKRFLSIEPMLSHIDIKSYLNRHMEHSGDRCRDSVHVPGRNGNVFDRRERAHMEAQKDVWKSEWEQIRVSTNTNIKSREIGITEPSSSDVHAQRKEDGCLCSSSSLDVSEQARNTGWNGDQSQGREPEEQSSGESGNCDATAEHTSCRKGAWSAREERAVRGKEFERQAQAGRCFGHQIDVGSKADDSGSNGKTLRCVSGNDQFYLPAKNLGAPSIDWVIVGGESGPGARPMSPDWARSIRDQCEEAGVALFVKQMGGSRDKRGELFDLPDDLRIREVPHANS